MRNNTARGLADGQFLRAILRELLWSRCSGPAIREWLECLQACKGERSFSFARWRERLGGVAREMQGNEAPATAHRNDADRPCF